MTRIPPRPPLIAIEVTREELESMEEGTKCSSGLMCRGLTIQNLPAFVGWYLESDDNGYEHGRTAYSWRYDAAPGEFYCEDCVLAIEEDEREARGTGW